MGKKLFWSRDRLVKHEFDCLGLGFRLGLGLRDRVVVVVRVVDSYEYHLSRLYLGEYPVGLFVPIRFR